MFSKLINQPKAKNVNSQELEKQRREKTAQEWIPIADIERNFIYRKDGYIVGMLRVLPINLELLSQNEKRQKVEVLTECFNGVSEEFQIFCIGRPVDLNNYLEWLQDKIKTEQNFTKKMLLKNYMQHASEMAYGGDTIERRFYIILSKKYYNDAEIDIIQKLDSFKVKLAEAELDSYICSDDELLDVLSLFANPIYASFEKTEIQHNISTLLEY